MTDHPGGLCFIASACFGSDQGQFPGNMFFAAAGDSAGANLWNNGNNCGKHYSIQCQGNGCRGSGAITIKIVDRCPNGCSGGRAFDLSSQAFAAIADPNVGVITVKYSLASAYDDGDAAVPWEKEQLIAEVGYGGQWAEYGMSYKDESWTAYNSLRVLSYIAVSLWNLAFWCCVYQD